MVSQGHSIPQYGAVTWLICLAVAILANNILHCVKLTTAMVRVDHNLRAAQHGLLATVHQMIRVNTVLRITLTLAVEAGYGRSVSIHASELIVIGSCIASRYSI